MIPYGRQSVDEDDIAAVCEVLRSPWLTTGPAVDVFERAIAEYVGVRHAVAVSNGTAALHALMYALGVGPGDEVIVPAMTFVATANAVVYRGARPVFVDVDPDTLLVDPEAAAKLVGPRTKAIVGVDYAGQPADYGALRELARRHDVRVVADACHALGAARDGRRAGALADATVFSFHPVKHVTTGEGGMITTDDPELFARARLFRNHGIATDQRERAAKGTFEYEMVELGHNLRLTDLQCALGASQLRKLPRWLERRRAIAARYDAAFASGPVAPLAKDPRCAHAYHLYVVKLAVAEPRAARAATFAGLRARGIGANVHYMPVHLHPWYRRNLGTTPGMCPRAEQAYEAILSLPMYPAMTDDDVASVIRTTTEVVAAVAPGGDA